MVLAFLGLLILTKTEQGGVGGTVSVIGLLMAGGLIWVIRRQNYKGFVAATRAVEPLGERYCPYCKLPFSPLQPLHCRSCKVDVIID
jgi:hypothetical protein